MEILIFWILCGGLCYFIAKDKNRNEWIALLMGILFGFFAIIYYLAVSKKEINNSNKE